MGCRNGWPRSGQGCCHDLIPLLDLQVMADRGLGQVEDGVVPDLRQVCSRSRIGGSRRRRAAGTCKGGGSTSWCVPLVCVPGTRAEQPVVAARVAALGAGKMISRDAPAGELREEAIEVMTTAAFRASAGRLARLIERQECRAWPATAMAVWQAR
jgi:hypothetical protein